jgi:hypothetical protein
MSAQERAAADTRWLLATSLSAAVPLRLAELAQMTPHARMRAIAQWAQEGADAVSHNGDALQYGGKPGEAAKAFNSMARGVAAAAHVPGGIPVFGLIFCARHAPGGRAVTVDNRCPDCATSESEASPPATARDRGLVPRNLEVRDNLL